MIGVLPKCQMILFFSRYNQQSHIINILLASFARSVEQVMDPRYFHPCFQGPRASRLGYRRKGKISVHNLPYGPSTWLIRARYVSYFASIKRGVIIINQIDPPPLDFFGFKFLLLDRLLKALAQLFLVCEHIF